jgi:uncharacterized OB-fold protein
MSATSDYLKPLPEADPVSAPYWESLKAHELKLQHCGGCGKFIFYPRGICPHCHSEELTWQPVSGKGSIHSFTIIYRHWNPAFNVNGPFAVALVELEEGPRLVANLADVEADPASISIGAPVELLYDDVTPEVTLPKFRLA